MTLSARALGFPSLTERPARTGLAVRGESFVLALAANSTTLDHVAGRAALHDAWPGTYTLGWTPSAQTRFAWVRWRGAPFAAGGSAISVDLALHDGAGHSVLSSSPAIPSLFKGETLVMPGLTELNRYTVGYGGDGFIDLDSIRGTLTDPDWYLVVTLTSTSTGAPVLNDFQLVELPRFSLDDTSASGGAVPGYYQGGRPICGSTAGVASIEDLTRILSTLEYGRRAQRTYLQVYWPESTTLPTVPCTSATSDGALTGLAEVVGGTSTPIRWAVSIRRLYAASNLGEPIRWRARYRCTGLGGETAAIVLHTGSTSSPFSASGLAAGGGWTWTPWVTGYAKTSAVVGPTTLDSFSVTGSVSAATATLYLAGIQVIEAQP